MASGWTEQKEKIMKCPGQDTLYWKPGAIFEANCPKCGNAVEFFKDDTSRKCNKCGHRFVNPDMDFGCAAYCPYAEQCIGDLPPELLAQKEDLLKDRVAIEMKRYFKNDFKRIGHASRVARYAERIGKKEKGLLAVILTAAYLHDIGIHAAEKKHGRTAAEFQETEGPAIARSILDKLGAKKELIDEVCDIIGHHHHPRSDDTINFKVVYDADLLENLAEKQKKQPRSKEEIENIITRSFLTDSGRETARKVLLGE
jgi:predicted HD phosphohydrolase